jgi:putative nucleotidyltransferase with HDIG domain
MTGTKENRKKRSWKSLRPRPEDLKAYSLIAVLGLLLAFIVQKGTGVQQFIGGFMVCTILLLILYRDILRYKPDYLKKQGMLILLGSMIVGTIGLGWLSEFIFAGLMKGLEVDAGRAELFGIPVAAGAMLIALLFDFHAAIMFSFVVSLLTGLWLADAAFAVYAFVGSLTAAFSMIKCRKRSAILLGGALVLGANVLTVVTILLFGGGLFTTEALYSLAFALVSALAVVSVVSLALPILEYLFKVTTDISLLELSDLDQPLMKNLMINAPGTYHHSIILGNLVESCAEAVGVNPLLARLGAYYHDIGKMKMPEYFIENQAAGVSRHEKLTPSMSGMILISHVKEGVELATEYKLPEVVKEIIQQHHGNALITYFYEKAKNRAERSDVSEDEFKYPGPRPQSRVAALIMMADAVEAASRVLNEPTPARIESLVDRIINHIFLDGQLDECELTLRDIYEIKKRFTYILTGILHKRIDYPGFDFNGGKKDGEGNGKQQSKENKAVPAPAREGLPKGPQGAWAPKG